MGRINPLVNDFLDKHPADSARILEQLPLKTTCSLIRIIQSSLAAGIVECMITSYGSECLQFLDKETAVSVITLMKTPQAARLLRAVSIQSSQNFLDMLPPHVKNNIRSSLRYPEQTVGRVMDANPVSLPETISINDAVKRVKSLRGKILHEIFVVDDEHKLKGVIHVADMLSAARSASLQRIITSDVPYISTRTAVNTAAVHLGWQTFSTLPVVDKDHILSGVLKSSTLMHVLAETRRTGETPDVVDDLFSMMKMYWISMAELINTVAGNIKERSARRD